jgi:flavin reductase (DIM6/NTAB) family NADH-FMN oxidoreductase RutF
MDADFVTIRMSDLTSLEAYNLLVSTVVPRPIAFVSTVSLSGVANLAPFSFFMAGGSNPPSLMYSPSLNKNGEPKDSLRNVLESEEFVVNSVHREMAHGMNASSFEYAGDDSEWGVSGFTPVPSLVVMPPRVLESFVQFECKLFRVIEHGAGPNAARYVIGDVVYAHLERHIAEDPARLRSIGRLSGPDYVDLNNLEFFSLPRPGA